MLFCIRQTQHFHTCVAWLCCTCLHISDAQWASLPPPRLKFAQLLPECHAPAESFAGAAEHQHLARRWSSAQGLLKERAAQQAQAGRSSTPVLALRGPGSGRERFAAPPAQSDDTPLTI